MTERRPPRRPDPLENVGAKLDALGDRMETKIDTVNDRIDLVSDRVDKRMARMERDLARREQSDASHSIEIAALQQGQNDLRDLTNLRAGEILAAGPAEALKAASAGAGQGAAEGAMAALRPQKGLLQGIGILVAIGTMLEFLDKGAKLLAVFLRLFGLDGVPPGGEG